MRQAELGVGDCGGLRWGCRGCWGDLQVVWAMRMRPPCRAPPLCLHRRCRGAASWPGCNRPLSSKAHLRRCIPSSCLPRLIPGMTKSGVQKRPGWLDGILGLDSE